ncbi:hypothetical protein EDEG_01603 [Edhazardia aedis USNM 41457]|uniref:Septin-type G domain-containing protein n=1 Tax=Edhazardia aedis (strain USNM 41457) TaxID=1003232 RepID=J8ZWT5_EDHAE|nr:hypothetical protein EDEG_01603 [Edhazardia aedis USNM 41457]|eukprot:EJW04123.1 hypothetical protein EDEG_01603 [Edhazardia aedis USNM 41457]
MEKKGIGIASLPNQKYRSYCQFGLNYNIMVVGPRGSGKSSFINMLLETSFLSLNPFDTKNITNIEFRSKEYPHKVTKTNPQYQEFQALKNNAQNSILFEDSVEQQNMINFQVTEGSFTNKKYNIKLSVTEVDNIGDLVNNTGTEVPIIKYISELYLSYMEQEKKFVKSKINDKRIHVALYFIDSSIGQLREIDIICIQELSRLCNVIPVISKSDFLTDNESLKMFESTKRALDKAAISLCDPRTNKLWHEVNENAPFFIVSNTIGKGINGERVLDYAKIKLDSEDFNDLKHLKKILISEYLLDLIQGTDFFYEMFKTDLSGKEITENTEFSDLDKELITEFVSKIQNQHEEINSARKELLIKKKNLEDQIKELDENVAPSNLT